MKRGLYANRPNLTIGFHGCDQSVVDKVIAGNENLLASTNDYDWLGSGIYFWENNEERAYDSVRGVFWEGKPLYPNAGFAEKNHIQICICNPNCIKGYFLPRNVDEKFVNP